MQDYYVYQTEADAQAALNYINGSSWFPITSKVNGIDAPDKPKTTKWADAPSEMTSGEFAVPRVPAALLDYIGVPEEDRIAFIAAFGQDIRPLTTTDFPEIPFPGE